MAKERFETRALIPAAADVIYRDWLSPEGHAAMTGSPASGEAKVGGMFTAWGGYISGEHLELEEGRRIVQAWRTLDFADDAAPSRVEITLTDVKGGTDLVITHSDIPEAVAGRYEKGWAEHYFDPMKRHYRRG